MFEILVLLKGMSTDALEDPQERLVPTGQSIWGQLNNVWEKEMDVSAGDQSRSIYIGSIHEDMFRYLWGRSKNKKTGTKVPKKKGLKQQGSLFLKYA